MRADRDELIDRCRENAERRTAEARANVQRELTRLRSLGQTASIAAVAETSGVSRSFIYKHPDLRDAIKELDGAPANRTTRDSSGDRLASLETQLTHTRQALKQAQAHAARLEQENAVLRGEIQAIRRKGRLHPS